MAVGALMFEDGLKLVYARAMAMQKAYQSARVELAKAIGAAPINTPICQIYQSVDALLHTDTKNFLKQLTAPVRWTQSVKNMIADGMPEFVECGPGQVLTGLIGRIQKDLSK